MSSFRSKSAPKSCGSQSKSIKFVTSCTGHVYGMKKQIGNNSSITHQNQVKHFREEVDGHFLTVDANKLILWAAYSVRDLFNCKHKPFISTALVNANRLLTYVGHSYG